MQQGYYHKPNQNTTFFCMFTIKGEAIECVHFDITVAMLEEKMIPWGIEVYLYANSIFCVRKNDMAAGHTREHSP